jgi:acetate kinase
MRILVFNSGSSSLKFQLFEIEGNAASSILRGSVRDLGGNANCEWQYHGQQQLQSVAVHDHGDAAELVLGILDQHADQDQSLLKDISAIGHRIVHGGDTFSRPILLDDETYAALDKLSQLAPLHNPPALAVVRACQNHLNTIPMIAVFDTAFFHELPEHVHSYALPGELRSSTYNIRRYGFHGLAHRYMSERYHRLNNTKSGRVITLQLGHGCSIAAIRDGRPQETSMGFTPLEGLIMATRPGDLDIGIVLYLLENGIATASDLNDSLNHRAGLLGLSGVSANMQELLALESEGHAGAALAINAFCHRIRKYVGAYLAVLGGADAIIFGGGIGELSPEIRRRICNTMEWCGLDLDKQINQSTLGTEARISTNHSQVAAYVMTVDEESLIALDTLNTLSDTT